MIWCPRCKYKTSRAIFPMGRCPQCGASAGPTEALTRDPYAPKERARHQSTAPSKKFIFDQKNGSDTDSGEGSGAMRSKPISTLYDIKGRI